MSLRVEADDPTSPANPNLWRALTEPMLTYADHPEAPAEFEAVVYNESREYLVNLDVGFCTCPGHQFHCEPDEDCKHLLRARIASGELEIPEWVTTTAIDDLLRKRLEEEGRRC